MQKNEDLALKLLVNKDITISDKVNDNNNNYGNSEYELLIWNKFISGSETALGNLYDLYINPLFSYGISQSTDRNHVLDCIHDLFLDLYKYKSNLSPNTNVKFYLFKSLKRKINKKYLRNIKSISIDEFEFNSNFSKQNHNNSCERYIINDEQKIEKQKKLELALAKLTKKQREILFLKFNKEKSYEEISDLLKVSIETARTSVYRAIKSLRKQNT